jgi:Mn-dependent DtxR family transcriptional regulator
MAEVTEELKASVVTFFKERGKMAAVRDVAKALEIDHSTTKKAITELVNDGTLEFISFGGATFIKLTDS